MSPMKEKSATVAAVDTSLHEKTNVPSITKQLPTHQTNSRRNTTLTSTVEDVASTHSSLSLAPQQEKSLESHSSPYNPSEPKPLFNTTQTSFEGDLEAQAFAIQQSQATVSQTGLLYNKNTSDPMWPNLQELKRKKKAIKRERACCACWASLTKKQRSIISSLIIIVILGAGLGVGFGISKHVGGGVVSSRGNNSPVLARRSMTRYVFFSPLITHLSTS